MKVFRIHDYVSSCLVLAVVGVLTHSAGVCAFQSLHRPLTTTLVPRWSSSSRGSIRGSARVSSGETRSGSVLFRSTPPSNPTPNPSAALNLFMLEDRKEELSNVTTALVPAIPFQDDPAIVSLSVSAWRRLGAQFRPRFVAREFLYGARYMCDVLPLLIAGSIIGHALRCVLAAITTGSAVIVAEPQRKTMEMLISPFHRLDIDMKAACFVPMRNVASEAVASGVCSKQTALLTLGFLSKAIIGPIVEEVSYRGVCQYLSAYLTRVTFWVRSNVFHYLGVRFSLALQAISFLSIVTDAIASIVQKKPVIGGSPFCHIFPVVMSAILIPPVLDIALFLLQDPSTGTDDSSTSMQNIPNDTWQNWNRTDGIRHRITKTIEKAQISRQVMSATDLRSRHRIKMNILNAHRTRHVHHIWQSSVDQATSRYSRWMGASYFGAAHGSGGPFCLQKIFGTIVSSLLVESRLVANRRTLWGAVGAHIFFNGMNYVLPLPLLLQHAIVKSSWIWPFVIVAYPLYVAELRSISKGLRRLELRIKDKAQANDV